MLQRLVIAVINVAEDTGRTIMKNSIADVSAALVRVSERPTCHQSIPTMMPVMLKFRSRMTPMASRRRVFQQRMINTSNCSMKRAPSLHAQHHVCDIERS